MRGSAAFSEDHQYRYMLGRFWTPPGHEDLGGTKPKWVLWVMLNPSKATATTTDHTITKCIHFSREEWAYDGMMVANLFAYRSTDPKALLRVNDPVGDENNKWLRRMAERCSIVVLAWGKNADRFPKRTKKVLKILKPYPTYCLGTTGSGQPLHPLRLAYSTDLQPYKGQP